MTIIKGEHEFLIRHAQRKDLEEIVNLERLCFPENEAASEEDFSERLKVFPQHFWLLEHDGKIISAINGMTTDIPDLQDRMYHHAEMHSENGKWQMIFGVTTHPEYRNFGCASLLMTQVFQDVKAARREGVVLTCERPLLGYYERFGFVNEGISASVHGNVQWYQMRKKINNQHS